MTNYKVWFTVRGAGGRTSLDQIVKAKDKDEAKSIVRREWYGENPEINLIKISKEARRPNPQGGETCEELGDTHGGEGYGQVCRLNNHYDLNPEYGTWANFLKTQTDLKEESGGWKHYVSSNQHYIVTPDGEVKTFNGYHGNAAFAEFTKSASREDDYRGEGISITREQFERYNRAKESGEDVNKIGLSKTELLEIIGHHDSMFFHFPKKASTVELDLPDDFTGASGSGIVTHRGYSYTTKTGKTIHVKSHTERVGSKKTGKTSMSPSLWSMRH
jgi:hypothetical protein